jgi:hypothetical protein
VRQISAEVWRRQFLYARQQRSGATAKDAAIAVARDVIVWSQVRRPTSLRDDTAEAILIGLWGVLDVGWLAHVPAGIRHAATAHRHRSMALRSPTPGADTPCPKRDTRSATS